MAACNPRFSWEREGNEKTDYWVPLRTNYSATNLVMIDRDPDAYF